MAYVEAQSLSSHRPGNSVVSGIRIKRRLFVGTLMMTFSDYRRSNRHIGESDSIAAEENSPVRRIQRLFDHRYEFRLMVWHFEMTHLVQQHPLIDWSYTP